MKKILSTIYIGVLSLLFVAAGLTVSAQFGGGFTIPSPWYFEDSDSVNLRDSTWEIGSSATRLLKGWFTDVDISGVLTLGGVVGAGGIDLDGNALIFDADADTQIDSTTDDRLDIQLGPSGDNLQYSAGAFAFQEGTTISTTAGALTLSPNTNTVLSTGFISQASSTIASTLNITGALTLDTALTVGNGGIGGTSLTDNAVLVGSGTGAITALTVGTNGQILVGSSSADPVFATLNCDTNLTCTTGAGTLEIDVNDAFLVNNADGTTSGKLTIGGGFVSQASSTFTNVTTSFNGIPYGWPVDNGTSNKRLTTDGTGVLTWETLTAGASLALDNLVSVAINTSLISDLDSTDDLGSSSIFWDETFSDELIFFVGGMGTTATDEVRLAALDLSAGDAGLHIKTEDDTEHLFASLVGIATSTPTSLLSVGVTTGSQFLVDTAGNVTIEGTLTVSSTSTLNDIVYPNSQSATAISSTNFGTSAFNQGILFSSADGRMNLRLIGGDGNAGSLQLYDGDNPSTEAAHFQLDGAGTLDIQSDGRITFTDGANILATMDANKFTPGVDSGRDLGSSSLFWDETFTDEIVFFVGGMGTTATDQVRLAALDLVAGDAGFYIKTEDDTEHLFASSVGIATTTPVKAITIHNSSATSTIFVNSGGAGFGGSIILEDNNGSTCTEITTNAGTIIGTVVTCP